MKRTGDQLTIITRILILIGMFLLVLFVPSILQIGGLFQKTPGVIYIAAILFLVVYIGIAVLGWWILKPNLSKPQFKRFSSEEINTVFKTYGLILVLNIVFNYFMKIVFNSGSTENQANINSLLSSNVVTLIVFGFAGAFIAPFVEEFIFRGIVINYFFKHRAWWLNVVLSGIIFSLGHASSNPISFALYATMGMILAYTFKKSGQIKMSIAVHMLNNTVAMIITIVSLLFM
ncbi:CPBP family intramembrane glutamic endopeptidase [Periweissella fabalis]|uniref:CPBP family intramembrane metalloprotease n=1 Tax=Periweissella fabalis TaxID=1070421 RepID=A0A7X6N1X6_9LACO|nr:type II CAAX endopeptidase family protein [Periweissella fabalis]MCM0598688.1 CPBP family intramembrane metalloprotease [Periweissella fabalis]NKZ24341.1 CPBP family intramembrane metalloprotease [Periweissella fabalis]